MYDLQFISTLNYRIVWDHSSAITGTCILYPYTSGKKNHLTYAFRALSSFLLYILLRAVWTVFVLSLPIFLPHCSPPKWDMTEILVSILAQALVWYISASYPSLFFHWGPHPSFSMILVRLLTMLLPSSIPQKDGYMTQGDQLDLPQDWLSEC